jgi:hypothetical protein
MNSVDKKSILCLLVVVLLSTTSIMLCFSSILDWKIKVIREDIKSELPIQIETCDKYCHYQTEINDLKYDTVRLNNLINNYHDDISMEEAFELNKNGQLFIDKLEKGE